MKINKLQTMKIVLLVGIFAVFFLVMLIRAEDVVQTKLINETDSFIALISEAEGIGRGAGLMTYNPVDKDWIPPHGSSDKKSSIYAPTDSSTIALKVPFNNPVKVKAQRANFKLEGANTRHDISFPNIELPNRKFGIQIVIDKKPVIIGTKTYYNYTITVKPEKNN